MYLGMAAFLLQMVSAVSADVETLTVDCDIRSWFRNDGQNSYILDPGAGAIGNTWTGQDHGTETRSFFVFDLSGVTGSFQAGVLRLEQECYASLDAWETFTVYDCDASSGQLTTGYDHGNTVGQAIFNDLGTGKVYGHGYGTAATTNTVLEIPLTSAAIVDLNAAVGDEFNIGIRLDSPFNHSNTSEAIRFSLPDNFGGEPRVRQLVLTPVPEPACLALLLIGTVVIVGRREPRA